MALKSTEEERAILRARSALQRFPVVEWRQRIEDFHRRSITTSRNIAGVNTWRESDCDGGTARPIGESEDWNPVTQAHPTQPDWDNRSVNDYSHAHSPTSQAHWSQETLTPVVDGPYTPGVDSPNTPVREGGPDYFSDPGASTPATPQGYNGFLERANRAIAKDHRHAPDPFVDGGLAPSRPFGEHSRVSSVESISSIVDEKSNSPLNKAMASVSFKSHVFASIGSLIAYSTVY